MTLVGGGRLTVEELIARIDERPGALGSLQWHSVRDLGLIPDTPQMRRQTRTVVIPGVAPSSNVNAVRSHWKGDDAAKQEWQGKVMRAVDEFDLPRPIPALRTLWVHAVKTYPKPRLQESENRRRVFAKAAGDALVGPLWRWEGVGRDRKMVPHDRSMYFEHRRYVGGWLEDDKDRYWTLTMAIDPAPGDYSTLLRLTWDEAPE